MRLSAYLLRTRALGDEKVPSHLIDGLGEMIANGADLAALLKKRSANLSARHILGIWRAYARHAQHNEATTSVMKTRREAKQKPLTVALLKQTIAAHEIEVLERAENMAEPGKVAEHRRRDAIKEAIALWNACLALTRREAKLEVTGELPGEPVETLQGMTSAQWVALRAGLDAGTHTVEVELPMERFVEQVSKRGAELSAVGVGLKAEDLLEALVLKDVQRWAFALKDEEVRLLGARDAGNAYMELLTTEPVSASLIAGVWLDGDQISLAITADGSLRAEVSGEVDGDVGATVEKLLGTHPLEALMLPYGEASEPIRKHFEDSAAIATVDVNASGAEAQAGDGGPALVLAQRALKPLETWSAADPMTLGLAEFPDFMDPDALAGTLGEIKALALAGITPNDLLKPTQKRNAPRSATKPLNPMIKSVDDLRPGMEVNGLVTNITQFGAFVNIGLSHEGLIHVSELADHFVNDPKEVVQIGQAVVARVLGVDRGRRRISLSLRPDRSAPRPGGGPPGEQSRPEGGVRLDDIPGTRAGNSAARRRSGFGGDRPRQAAHGNNRTQALKDLEALFKKK